VKLRTKFLLSLLLVSSALTCATLLVVRRAFQVQIRKMLVEDLHGAVLTFQNFEHDRQQNLIRSAELLASLPNLKALMTTHHAATIQDASGELWPLVGSDLFVLSDPEGHIVALHSAASGVSSQAAEEWLRRSLVSSQEGNWWFIGGHLFEVFLQPIYFGSATDSHLLGILSVGYEVNDRVAREVGAIAASQVIFRYGDTPAASTLGASERGEVVSVLARYRSGGSEPCDITVGRERFLSTSVNLGKSSVPVSLVVLKSFDQATQFLRTVNQLLLGLGLVAILVGSGLVFFISHTFTQPLEDLVGGVRALEKGDFHYPLGTGGNDEVAELTSAFDRMRQSILVAQQRLLEAERLATIGQMASSISHDLRHRLTAIVANAEFLAEAGLDSSQRQELYQEVSAAVHQMTDLLESLLEFSRTPESLHPELVSIEDVVRRSIAAIRTDPAYQHVVITVEAAGEVQGWFDPKKLERVFYNLLLNACEMLPHDSGRIDVRIERQAESVQISVADNGPGIPAHLQDKVFQPFVSYGKQNGSGLGLAIVQKICQDHGGEVSLKSAAPGGTTFKIVLPIQVGRSGEQPPSAVPVLRGERQAQS